MSSYSYLMDQEDWDDDLETCRDAQIELGLLRNDEKAIERLYDQHNKDGSGFNFCPSCPVLHLCPSGIRFVTWKREDAMIAHRERRRAIASILEAEALVRAADPDLLHVDCRVVWEESPGNNGSTVAEILEWRSS